MTKTVLTFFTVCLLSTVFLMELSFNVQPVKASGTIYIRADGSVEPETAPISSVDNVTYTFTDNIYDEIVVERNNIVVDGSGYTLQGQGIGCGFFLDSINNVTIKRTLIKRFSKGIMLNSSSFNVVSENNITDNWDGVDLYWSSSNTISGNDITNNGWGVTLHSSSNNTIITNNITKHLYASERTPVGVQLFLSSNNTISGNNVTNNYSGVHLHESSFNTICGNDIANNPYRSLYLSESFNNTIYRNKITNNGSVFLDSSSFNVVSENNIINNSYGVMLYWSSNNNIVSGNKITNNSYGFASVGGIQVNNGRRLYLSSNNTISGNNVTNNHLGVKLYLSFSNIIYHNNFINNTQQVYDYSWDHPEFSPSINSWDADYPSGGNYWSNYTGTDENHDGVGDTPHIIDANNTDNYPLMGTFSDFSATSEYHVQTICNSTISDFQFDGYAIRFNVTGENGTAGFCRLCIPEALYVCRNCTYRVFVNGTEILPSPEPLSCSNSTHNYLYFTYSHSTKEVVIIPEFPSFLVVPLFMLSTLLAAVLYRRK